MTTGQTHLVLVTGPSGAGRSTAINALEDMGFEAIDNLPLSLIDRLVVPGETRRLALGVDARNRDFSTDAMVALIARLTRSPELHAEILYLDANADILQRRYSETRRRHPLAPQETPAAGIAREADLLTAVRERAEILIDTSEMSPHDLRAELARLFDHGDAPGLALSVQSFSYKRGLPRGVDLVFDLRFLRNPHWEPGLRALDGRDAAVAEYVASDPRFDGFAAKLIDLILTTLPAYRDEGKTHLAIALGCTGGQHRSVAVAEYLAKALAEHGWRVSTRHRELERHAALQRGQAGESTP
ncbi:RNase adapter RapZ [Palleronia sp. LCG004]|uniref:RNase adapter RapZ n=1 Tax=Palleronia sp. LCG004 TaxID=3079304 RepID=UPI002943A5C7|nr:RNase adapter RapZ [Palleronia sp. LCG004]WOI56658.1 RNase adapter RapZ [Palleronia sp. LCG004]